MKTKKLNRSRLALIVLVASACHSGACQGRAGGLIDDQRALMEAQYRKDTHGIQVPTIDAAQLKHMIDTPELLLIDLREEAEQDVSMLPHALTAAQVARQFPAGIPASRRVIVYCTIGVRSGRYVERLAKNGVKATNLAGGILAWSYVRGALQARDRNGALMPTMRIHTYGRRWNLVHPDYTAVW